MPLRCTASGTDMAVKLDILKAAGAATGSVTSGPGTLSRTRTRRLLTRRLGPLAAFPMSESPSWPAMPVPVPVPLRPEPLALSALPVPLALALLVLALGVSPSPGALAVGCLGSCVMPGGESCEYSFGCVVGLDSALPGFDPDC